MKKKRMVSLSPAQVAELITECLQSAHDLYESGVVVHHQGIATTARALLTLSVEEYGKIGWLYRSLMLAHDSRDEWTKWWAMFWSHTVKNEVGRMMMTYGDGLMPILARFFRDGFPFFTIPPVALERQKHAMLYVDFDPETGEVIAPRKYMQKHGIEAKPLIGEVERLVRQVAVNEEAGVFRPEVLAAYKRLNEIATDEADRVTLLRLFYAIILRRPTGLVSEAPLEEVSQEVRRRHPEVADTLRAEWAAIGQQVRGAGGC